jgi:hypothetical protein
VLYEHVEVALGCPSLSVGICASRDTGQSSKASEYFSWHERGFLIESTMLASRGVRTAYFRIGRAQLVCFPVV